MTMLAGPRRLWAALVAGGGLLIVVGWFLPWGSAGAGSVNGLSDALQPWFRILVVATGLLAVAGGLLAGRRAAAWLIAVTTLVGVGWSLIFPAVVFVGARTLAGAGDVPAATGPSVTHGIGAYAIALGVVGLAVGCGPAITSKRSIWIATLIVAALAAVLLIVGLL